MERPNNIIWFERINLGTLALGLIQSWLGWPELLRMGASPAFVITTQLFTFGVIVGLTLLISRRRSNVAKWILIAMFILGMPFFLKQLFDGKLAGGLPVISLIQVAGQLLALALLFTPDSKDWFKKDSAANA